MRRPWIALGALLLALSGLLAAAPGDARAATPRHHAGLLTPGLADPSPPGSNDWDCRPSRRHPDPVVLVHGLSANQSDNWSYLAPILAGQGYCVYSLTYGRDALAVVPPLSQIGGLREMQDSAHELSRFVDRVRRATGAAKVDIVGHSEGSLMPDYYVKFLGGDRSVRRYVGMTPLWDGTRVLALNQLNDVARHYGLGPAVAAVFAPLCQSCRQFLRGSPFLRRLNSGGGPRVSGVTYTMIMTTHDELVVPYTSGRMAGATNIVLQDRCPNDPSEHAGVAFDPVNAQYVLNALDPDHGRPVRCTGF